ncbi:MAG: molybdopterin adenylyltransferase [Candidatus Thalassarchaeaceae archaeon]|jgi:molybdopterin adenylyltransferase|nr:molybdopterin adenylyltransferase [Candidatus Thalassarchaeaceae archaeon]MDP7649555.1 molybdopterin adenylyltransferase [Candidatus Thalassarchaeaceae archaeon]|tara:strand:- start:3511 stop:4104 length:594 start_codon:yes stop_codon:yes gene_type:complete
MTDVIFCIVPSGGAMSGVDVCRFGVLTASDRASTGDYEDLSGPAIERFLEEALTSTWEIQRRIVADEREAIEATLVELVDSEGCSVVVTTGGTGPAPRDVTPEATEAVCERMLPGFGEQMRAVSLKHVPTAVLSRQTAGIRGSSLILNLPGSPRSIREILDEVFAAVPYCVDLMGGPYITTDPAVVNAFRPPHARRE